MKTAFKEKSSDNKNASVNSEVKIDKKLNDLQIIESDKQKEIKKLTFKLSI